MTSTALPATDAGLLAFTTAYNLSMASKADQRSKEEAIAIQTYVSPILIILGTLGNLLSFLVLLRRRMRTTAMYNFLLVLAVADTTVLWVSCFQSWMRIVFNFQLLHHSQIACKTINYLLLSSTYLASWLIVLMTIHRFLAIWFPLEVQSKWNLQNARLACILLVFIAFASNFHVFWTFGLFDDNDHYFETNNVQYMALTNSTSAMYNDTLTRNTSEAITLTCTYRHDMPFMFYGFNVLKLFLYCLIPFGVVLIVNILIIFRVNRSSAVLSEEAESCICRPIPYDHRGENHPSRDRISYLLLTVSFTWLLLMLPYSLIDYISFFHNNHAMRIICYMLVYTNHSINFLLYCLTGRKFREELMSMLRLCKCRKHIVRINSGRSTLKTEIMTDGVPLKALKNYEVSEAKTNSKLSISGTPPKHNRSLT